MNRDFAFRLISISFVLAPVLMLLSDLSALIFGEQLFWVSTHLFWLSFYVFLGLIVGMGQLLNFSPYAVISALIAGFGALIGITIIGMSRYEWGLETEGVSMEVLASAHSNPWVFFTSRFPGITFPLGLIMLVVGLKRNNLINGHLLAGLIFAIVLFPLGRIPKELMINVAGDALMILFFGMVGKIYLKERHSVKGNT
jgi:hypothetical protein